MKSPRRFKSGPEAGQGTLEYVLVLMVIVILFLTVIYQFNDAFRQYATQFFDGYVACLLETGELPGRGGDCSSDLKKFKIADGKPRINGPIGDGSGGGGGGTGGAGTGGSGSNGRGGNGDGSGGKDGKGGDQASAGNKGGSGSGGGGGDGSEVAPSGAGNSTAVGSIGSRSKGRSKSTAVAQNKDDKDGAGGSKDSLIAPMKGMNGTSNGGSDEGRAAKTALDRGFGYWAQDDRKEEAEAKAPVTAVTQKNEGGDSLKSKKTSVDGTRKVASVVVADDEGFTFGKFIRIILITGIVLAIVVFMGGQLLQISKSSEK